MVAKIIHRVFVSSTYEDLREERAEVQKALLKLGCFPVGMELFPSADDETWEFIKRQIAESDYYIVIAAGRYGSLAPDGVSFTQKEYQYARDIGKPSIAFIRANRNEIAAKFCEEDPARRKLLEAFIEDLRKKPVCCYNNAHELAAQVIASIVDLRDRCPTVGYIRADEAADLKRFAELLEENASLRAQLEQAKTVPPFRGADTPVTVRCKITIEGKGSVLTEIESSWKKVFLTVAELLIDGDKQDYELERAFAATTGPAGCSGWSVHDFESILRKLFGLELIAFYQIDEPVLGRDYFRHAKQLWQLTPYGQKQYGILSEA